LYVANDFGRKISTSTMERFRDIAAEAGVEDIGRDERGMV
jgi:hypothetical protein